MLHFSGMEGMQRQQNVMCAHAMRNIEDCTGRLNQLLHIYENDLASMSVNGSLEQDKITHEK